jgi:hypothetical protein
MKFPIILCVLLVLGLGANAQQRDNRIKPGLKVGDVIPDYVPDKFLTEDALREKVASFRDEGLRRAVAQRGGLRLVWQQRVALVDADYFLCMFDSSVRVEPGHNPRVLILFTPDYELKSWAGFDYEPRFAAGCIVNRRQKPHTYFVTVNQSGRDGGTISFEKYLIRVDGITRLGTSNELTKIADAP